MYKFLDCGDSATFFNTRENLNFLISPHGRGAVRFYPKGPSSCIVELTVSYEVPQLLTPVASALQPFLEGLLRRGLERFATVAKSY
ncbi:hypothetical protein L6164_034824 [Bauhinia variegata]|uniref:Uncharacterized protein n=1 Tax=Bauhinia variegata TaxID=167791 RepID=A0ACB9KW21_BAUVA|nr:hypothetical protein L6164_034824 [Bauhinia variegata]